jgi:hypothetical protein
MSRKSEILLSVILGSLVVVAAIIFHHLIDEPDCFNIFHSAESAK